jgi:hypothetical protein
MTQFDFIILDVVIVIVFFVGALLFKKYVIGSLEDK